MWVWVPHSPSSTNRLQCSDRVKYTAGQLLESSPTVNMDLNIKVRILIICVCLLFPTSEQCNKNSETASTSVSNDPGMYHEGISDPGESQEY